MDANAPVHGEEERLQDSKPDPKMKQQIVPPAGPVPSAPSTKSKSRHTISFKKILVTIVISTAFEIPSLIFFSYLFDSGFGPSWTSDSTAIFCFIVIGICLFVAFMKDILYPSELDLLFRDACRTGFSSSRSRKASEKAENVDNGWDEEAEKRRYDEMFQMRFGPFVLNMYRYMFLGGAFRDGVAYLQRRRGQRATTQAVVDEKSDREPESTGFDLDLEKNGTGKT